MSPEDAYKMFKRGKDSLQIAQYYKRSEAEVVDALNRYRATEKWKQRTEFYKHGVKWSDRGGRST